MSPIHNKGTRISRYKSSDTPNLRGRHQEPRPPYHDYSPPSTVMLLLIGKTIARHLGRSTNYPPKILTPPIRPWTCPPLTLGLYIRFPKRIPLATTMLLEERQWEHNLKKCRHRFPVVLTNTVLQGLRPPILLLILRVLFPTTRTRLPPWVLLTHRLVSRQCLILCLTAITPVLGIVNVTSRVEQLTVAFILKTAPGSRTCKSRSTVLTFVSLTTGIPRLSVHRLTPLSVRGSLGTTLLTHVRSPLPTKSVLFCLDGTPPLSRGL